MKEQEITDLRHRIKSLESELKIMKSVNRSLNSVVENSPAAIVITDKNAIVEYVNPVFSKITGYGEDEIVGKNIRLLKSDYHSSEYYSHMWKSLTAGDVWKDSFYNKKKNGEGYWEQQYIGPVKDEKGEITHFAAVKIDITLQKEYEKQLKDSREYLNAITQALPEVIFVLNEDGYFEDVIATPSVPLYQEIAKAKGCHVRNYMPERMAEKILRLISETLECGEPKVLEYEMKVSGINKWFEGRSALFDSSYSKKRTIVLIAYDITERKCAQYALNESEKRLRSIFETANTGIAFSNIKGEIIFANPTFARILGYATEEIAGKFIKDLTPEEDYYRELTLIMEMNTGKKDKVRFEKRYIRKDGQVIWGDLSLSPMRNESNEIVYMVGMLNDITERVIAEKQLKALIATKDKFFSIIAHDLKNPFNALLGISELLFSNPESYDLQQVKELGKLMNESSRSAYDLLENLLQWSRSQLGQIDFDRKEYDLKELVDSCIKVLEMQALNKKIELRNLIKDGQSIRVDSNLFKTAIRNLCSNAVKYTKPGGWVQIDSLLNKNSIFITIEDSGIGMSQDVLNQLFSLENKNSTPGTSNERGTGLGLIICKEFVEKHAGKLLVESTPDVGTKFIIELPL